MSEGERPYSCEDRPVKLEIVADGEVKKTVYTVLRQGEGFMLYPGRVTSGQPGWVVTRRTIKKKNWASHIADWFDPRAKYTTEVSLRISRANGYVCSGCGNLLAYDPERTLGSYHAGPGSCAVCVQFNSPIEMVKHLPIIPGQSLADHLKPPK